MAFKTTVRIIPTREETRLTVANATGEILKARLPSASHRWAIRMLLDSLALLLGTRLSVVLSAEGEESFWMQDLSDGFGFGIDTICYEVDVVESRKRRPRHRLRLVPGQSEESER
jgi:hypothetical protein